MFKIITLIAFFFLISSISSQRIWGPCPGDRSKDLVQIIDIKTTPLVPKAGSDFTVTLLGRSLQSISGGNVHTKVYYDPAGYEYPFFEGDSDLCTSFGGAMQCPIAAGQLSRTLKAEIPSIAPRGGPYNGTISITNESGSTVSCVVFNFMMQ